MNEPEQSSQNAATNGASQAHAPDLQAANEALRERCDQLERQIAELSLNLQLAQGAYTELKVEWEQYRRVIHDIAKKEFDQADMDTYSIVNGELVIRPDDVNFEEMMAQLEGAPM